MDVPGQIDAHRQVLTPAERKVAAVIVDDPEAVAFGTVADIARRAGASGATVVRLATKLGYDGFVDLQGAVRAEMARRLRPASERIRRAPVAAGAGDVLAQTLRCELGNVASTLEGIDPDRFAAAVALLSAGRVYVLSGDASSGIASLVAAELSQLRPDVVRIDGSRVRIEAALAHAARGDRLLVIDLSRYDRDVVEATSRAAGRGLRIVALTDSALSPLSAVAEVALTVTDEGAGPFDSHVGVLALLNALVAAVADGLRRRATARLDRVEKAWNAASVLAGP